MRTRRITVANEYDALHRRNQRTYDDPGLGSPLMGSTATTADHYYTSSWQIIEDRVGEDVTMQFVWGALYVNGMVLRDRDTDTDGVVDERHYYQQDANFNVTALIGDPEGKSEWQVVERVVYDSYGAPTFLHANWQSSSLFSAYSNDVLFQGGRRDVNTGFINFQHRDYSVTLGRPIQVDWIRYSDSMSLYEWEMSNPVNRLDPSGTKCRVALKFNNIQMETDFLGWLAQGSSGIFHVGMVISDDQVTVVDWGPNGGKNIAVAVPAQNETAWGDVGYYKDLPDDVCACLRKAVDDWNKFKFKYEATSRNSNYALKCALKKCGQTPKWQGMPPWGANARCPDGKTECPPEFMKS